MGFRPPETVFRLVFDDPALEGMIVKATSVPTGVFLELSTLTDITTPLSAEDAAKIDRLFGGFADALIDWNIDHPRTGEPLPANEEGMRQLELPFMLNIILSWLDGVGSIVNPKAGSLPGSRLDDLPSEPLTK